MSDLIAITVMLVGLLALALVLAHLDRIPGLAREAWQAWRRWRGRGEADAVDGLEAMRGEPRTQEAET